MSTEAEKLLTLSDGRILAYADIGDPTSSLVVVMLHGFLGIGRATRMSPVLKARGVHFITPTLSGWGTSSPHPPRTSYSAALLSDFTELIQYLHPNDNDLRILVAGGSYGTVPAQILYGAPFDQFPLGRKIVGCMILAPFSPFRWHKEYTKSMTWKNYISVGPPAYYLPFIPALLAFLVRWKLSTVESTEKLIRAALFDKARDEERDAFTKWRGVQGIGEGELEREMAENAFLSMRQTSAGFIEGVQVLHGDWGFRPDQLDDEHVQGRPICIVASTEDDLGPDMAKWLELNYKNSTLEWTSGGHISGLYEMDKFWTVLIDRTTTLNSGL